MNMRSVVFFVVIAFARSLSFRWPTKFTTVSRRVNGSVSAVSDSHVFVVTIDNDGKFSVVAHPKTEKSFNTTGITIVPPDSQAGDQFGTRIAFNSKFVVISAVDYRVIRKNRVSRGIVYVYIIDEDQFTFKQKLLPDEQRDWFGRCIAINEDNDIVIGSYEGINGTHIFAYNNSTWKLVQKLNHNDINNVDISANEIVIGAEWRDGKNVYIYTRHEGVWKLKQTLPPQTQHSYPIWVKMYNNGSRLVVGDTGARKVYVYKRTSVGTWVLTDTLTGSAVSRSRLGRDEFARTVHVHDSVMVVAASLFAFNASLPRAGLVYLFQFDKERQVWEEKVRLTASDVSKYDEFGAGVVIDGNFVFVSSGNDDQNYRFTYMFEYGKLMTNGAQEEGGFNRDSFQTAACMLIIITLFHAV